MRRRHARSRFSAALALSLLIVTSEAQQIGSVDTDESLASFAVDHAAVAILPLEVLSETAGAVELAAVLYEALAERLGAINGLRVVGSGRVLPFADSGLGPDEIARSLGVGGVITGTVRIREGRWSVGLKAPGWSAGWDIGDAASDAPRAERISEVVSRVAEMVEGQAFPGRSASQQEIIAALRATVLDASLSDRERVEALTALPFVENASPGYAEHRTQALGGLIVETVAQIALDAEDPIVRVRAWTELAGVRDPGLLQPLLTSLADDTDVMVRKAAANRLIDGFADQAGVRLALEFAAENDASEDVRNHIRFASLSAGEQQQKLRAVALDSARSDRERAVAVGRLRYVGGEIKELDHDLVVVALEIARYSETPLARSYAWGFLFDSRDPYLVEPYLELIGTDPDEEVRERAASGLRAFLDYPGVREALDRATRDASIVVRRAAADSLRTSGDNSE